RKIDTFIRTQVETLKEKILDNYTNYLLVNESTAPSDSLQPVGVNFTNDDFKRAQMHRYLSGEETETAKERLEDVRSKYPLLFKGFNAEDVEWYVKKRNEELKNGLENA